VALSGFIRDRDLLLGIINLVLVIDIVTWTLDIRP
jgi:hypothetical protein